MVTIDGFQSAEFQQLLRKQNIETKYLSVDKKKDPYISLLQILILLLDFPSY